MIYDTLVISVVGIIFAIALVTFIRLNKRLLSSSFLNLYIETKPFIQIKGRRKFNIKFITNFGQILLGYAVCFYFSFIFIYYFLVFATNSEKILSLALSLALGITITIRYVSVIISTILGDTLWHAITVPSSFLLCMFSVEIIMRQFDSSYTIFTNNLFLQGDLKTILQNSWPMPVIIGFFSELALTKFLHLKERGGPVVLGESIGLYRENISEATYNIPVNARLIIGRDRIYNNLAEMLDRCKILACGSTITFNCPDKYKQALEKSQIPCRYIGPMFKHENETLEEYEERLSGYIDRINSGAEIRHMIIESTKDFRFLVVDGTEISVEFPGEHETESQTAIYLKNREIGSLFLLIFEKLWTDAKEIDKRTLNEIKNSVRDQNLKDKINTLSKKKATFRNKVSSEKKIKRI